jgi:histidinol dehydrogenase
MARDRLLIETWQSACSRTDFRSIEILHIHIAKVRKFHADPKQKQDRVKTEHGQVMNLLNFDPIPDRTKYRTF